MVLNKTDLASEDLWVNELMSSGQDQLEATRAVVKAINTKARGMFQHASSRSL